MRTAILSSSCHWKPNVADSLWSRKSLPLDSIAPQSPLISEPHCAEN
ncbi:unnamed protein product [Chondrus crispus]|uniref:Uncharacterized protein n=1 Tax=Chondrus crispus TaxID=2769 RepID=R7Q734_CHOCR|nr:unnamed protein product [Chondrus crispus]CDF33191.1 unnamed protein product [Chondrus crispus]|eukprot:XP_005712994.1 unnamed protein product [Chondrus crispus]